MLCFLLCIPFKGKAGSVAELVENDNKYVMGTNIFLSIAI